MNKTLVLVLAIITMAIPAAAQSAKQKAVVEKDGRPEDDSKGANGFHHSESLV